MDTIQTRFLVRVNSRVILTFGAEYYLIPTLTTTDVEKLFPTAGEILTNECNRLILATAEKLLFLHET